jgi:hypothetical protein
MLVRRLLETSPPAGQTQVSDRIMEIERSGEQLKATRQFAGYCHPGLKGSEAYMLGNAGGNACCSSSATACISR